MVKKRASEALLPAGLRRARLNLLTSHEGEQKEEQGMDPIAAAIAAKKRRQEEALTAAAAAAARSAAANVTTLLLDEAQHSQSTPGAAEELNSPAAVSNPLSSLLGYSHGESSEDEGSEDGRQMPAPALPQSQPVPTSTDTNSLDAELAHFMEELESSGLLSKEADQAPATAAPEGEPAAAPAAGFSSDTDAATAPSASIDSPPATVTAAEEGPEPEAAPAQPVDAGNSRPPSRSEAQATTAQAGQMAGREAAGNAQRSASTTTPAEQRVLGALEGCPGWHEVMDMASGKVYFWDSTTNAVAWEPPKGSQPRSKQENAVVFEAAQEDAAAGIAAAEDGGDPAAGDAVAGQSAGQIHQREAPANVREKTEMTADAGAAMPAAAVVEVNLQLGADTTAAAAGQTGELTVEGSGSAAAERASPSQAPPAKDPPREPKARPSAALQQAVEELAAVLEAQLAEVGLAEVPQLVALAVEACVRLRDWRLLAAQQLAAVDAAPNGTVQTGPAAASTVAAAVAAPALTGTPKGLVERTSPLLAEVREAEGGAAGVAGSEVASTPGSRPAPSGVRWETYEAMVESRLAEMLQQVPRAIEEADALKLRMEASIQADAQAGEAAQAAAAVVAAAAAEGHDAAAPAVEPTAQGGAEAEGGEMEEGEVQLQRSQSEATARPDAVGTTEGDGASARGTQSTDKTQAPAAEGVRPSQPPAGAQEGLAGAAAGQSDGGFEQGAAAADAAEDVDMEVDTLVSPPAVAVQKPVVMPAAAAYMPPVHHVPVPAAAWGMYPYPRPMGLYGPPPLFRAFRPAYFPLAHSLFPVTGVAAPAPGPAAAASVGPAAAKAEAPPVPDDDAEPPPPLPTESDDGVPVLPAAEATADVPPWPGGPTALTDRQPASQPAPHPVDAAQPGTHQPPQRAPRAPTMLSAPAKPAAALAAAPRPLAAQAVASETLTAAAMPLAGMKRKKFEEEQPGVEVLGEEAGKKKKSFKKDAKPSSKVGKATSQLINKWAAVHKDLVDEERKLEDGESLDPEALERKRLREADEWRAEQLRRGLADGNANFQPLASDWKERLKQKRAKKETAKAAKAAPLQPTPAPSKPAKPDLAALSVGLPPGWQAMYDRSSADVYYGNPATKETSWDRPT